MAAYFNEEQLAKLYDARGTLLVRFLRLQLRLQARAYKTERGKEFAFHGFLRRLGTLVRAIDQVFTILPPERESIPENDEVKDATIAIQAFVFNLVGCIDNLAWIWVSEKAVKAPNGADLDPRSVGLRKFPLMRRCGRPSQMLFRNI